MGRRAWYEGGCDALDLTVDIGPENQYEPDIVPNPSEPWRKCIEATVEFAARDPLEVKLECEQQDEMLGLPQGTTLRMLLDAFRSTH